MTERWRVNHGERLVLLRTLHAQRWRLRGGRLAAAEARTARDTAMRLPRRLPPLRAFGTGLRDWPRLCREALALRGTGLFDPEWYLLRHADIALSGVHPLWHWLALGWREGRMPNPLFEPRWYLAQYPDVAEAGGNPLLHYLQSGAAEGRQPGPLFDPRWYAAAYPDAAGGNPLSHFLLHGMEQGCEPGPDFDRNWYLRQDPEAAHCGIPPLWHYLIEGRDAGLSGAPPPGPDRAVPPREMLPADAPQAAALLPEAAADNLRADSSGTGCGRFTVILPTWNRRRVIGRAVDSVLAQSYADRELIVCDDGSTDDTQGFLESRYADALADGRMRYLRLPHRGVSAARNAGLREARGEWIAWLDSDNQWHPDYLQLIAAALAAEPDRRSAYACVQVNDHVHGRAFIRCLPFDWHRLLARNYIDLNVFVHHRSLYEEFGGFDEALRRLVDWDLVLRYTREHPPLYVPCVLAHNHLARGLRNITLSEGLYENARAVRLKHKGRATTDAAPTQAATSSGKAAAPPAPAFRSFEEFERRSLFVRELSAPFSEEARRVLGHMRAVRRHLSQAHPAGDDGPLISVVVAAREDTAAGRAAVDSALAQDHQHVEVLLVGHGLDIATLEADSRLRHIPSGNANAAALRNLGLAAARGEFIAWLDPGHTMEPDCLRILAGTLRGSPDCGIAYCAQTLLHGKAVTAVRWASFSRATLENRDYIDLGSVLCRRALAQRCDGFDESAPHASAWGFLLRMTEVAGAMALPCALATGSVGGAPAPKEPAGSGSHEPIADQLPDHRVPGLERMTMLPTRVFPDRPRAVSVVIPSYECLDFLQLCIDAVGAFTDLPHEIIVVDNGSSQPVRDFLARIAGRRGIRCIQNATNLGFSYAANQGIAAAAPGNDVVLLNNDAVVTPGWAGALQRVFEDVPDAGLAVSRQVLLPGTPTLRVHSPACNVEREVDVNLSAHHDNVLDALPGAMGYAELAFAPFFCVYIPRATLDSAGPLDHESAPHYRSDRLYCEVVRRILRRRVIYTPHAKVYHFLQQATAALKRQDRDGFEAMFVRNAWTEVRNRK